MESRLTFHNIQTTEAWQHKIRTKREKFYNNKTNIWDNIDKNLKKTEIRSCTFKQAKKMILEYEWLGTMGAGTNRYYGIYFDDILGGVTCWSDAGFSLPSISKKFNIKSNELGYLCRGACPYWTPKGTASKLISYSLKLEKKRGTKLAIAFSDTDAGEYGTVYQATNWICIGKSNHSWDQYISPKNKLLSFNRLTAWAKKNNMKVGDFERLLVKKGWKKQKTNSKYRYVYILTDDISEKNKLLSKINPMITEYPKRAVSIENDVPAIHAGKGGEIPTTALHI